MAEEASRKGSVVKDRMAMFNTPRRNNDGDGTGSLKPPPLFPRPQTNTKPIATTVKPEETKDPSCPSSPETNSLSTNSASSSGDKFPPIQETNQQSPITTPAVKPSSATALVKPFHSNTDVDGAGSIRPPPPPLPRTRMGKPAKGSPPQATDEVDIGALEVTGFEETVDEEALRLHFQNKRKGGGPLESLTIIDGKALVKFISATDAKNALEKEQVFRGLTLTVKKSHTQEKYSFIFFGLIPSIHLETLQDFLEGMMECEVQSKEQLQEIGTALVVFAEDNCPDLETLQRVCRENKLQGCHLSVSPSYEDENEYLIPSSNSEITSNWESTSLTSGKIQFIERFAMKEFQGIIDHHRASFKFSKSQFILTLTARVSDLENCRIAVQRLCSSIQDTEHQIHMPGVVTFMKCAETKAYIKSLEEEHQCIIETQEGTYEIVTGGSEEDDHLEADDSEGSAGSVASKRSSGAGLKDNTPKLMRRFKIGNCRLNLKNGNVARDESDCLVNICSDYDIENGVIWGNLDESDRTKAKEKKYEQTWKKNGIFISETEKMQTQWILHVCQSFFKKDFHKTVTKCLQTVNAKEGVSSVAFSLKAFSSEDVPKQLFKAIHKFQRGAQPRFTISLVEEDMDGNAVEAVENQITKIIDQRSNSATSVFATFKGKIRQLSLGSQEDPDMSIYGTTEELNATSSQKRNSSEEMWNSHLVRSEVTVYINSYDKDKHDGVHDRLGMYCDEKMPLKVLEDKKIKQLTEEQLERLRSKKVGVFIDKKDGKIEFRGYSADVTKMCDKLEDLLQEVRDEVSPASIVDFEVFKKQNKEEIKADLDEDETLFVAFIANRLRQIPEPKRGKLRKKIENLVVTAT